MERAIFLDFDGVLFNHKAMQGLFGWDADGRPRPDPSCVEQVNRIVDEAQVRAVIVTSTWRLHYRRWRIVTLLRQWGVRGAIGFTPDLSCPSDTPLWRAASRGDEIQHWLGRRPSTWRFVILDDTNDVGGLAPHLIRTNPERGLTREQADRAIAHLLNVAPA